MMKTFNEKYGPWALVTGASSGIGTKFAEQLAAKGLNIVLVARRKDRLEALAEDLKAQNSIKTHVIVADLTSESGIEIVKEETQNLDIGLLINNAGVEDSGHFLDTPIKKAIATLELNGKTPLVLTHHFARQMTARKRGGILFMSSLVAFQGTPYIANYAASKAYSLILAESLAAELQKYHVDVLSVNPGFTNTALSPDFNFDGLPIKPIQPAHVVTEALKAMGTKRVVVPGTMNKFLYFTGKYLQPRRLNTFAFGKVFSSVLRNKLKGSLIKPNEEKIV